MSGGDFALGAWPKLKCDRAIVRHGHAELQAFARAFLDEIAKFFRLKGPRQFVAEYLVEITRIFAAPCLFPRSDRCIQGFKQESLSRAVRSDQEIQRAEILRFDMTQRPAVIDLKRLYQEVHLNAVK